MLESAFSKIIRDDIYYHLTKPEKIVDGVVKRKRRTPHVELVRDSYNSGKKSYDFYFVYANGFWAIELKVAKGQSVKLDCVSKHQIEGLYDAEHSSKIAHGYVVIFLQDYNKGDKALVIPVYNWVRIIKANKDKKSLKIDSILEKYDMYVNVMVRQKIDRCLHWDIKGGIIDIERY